MRVYYYAVLVPAEIYFQASSSSLTCIVCVCSGTKEGIHIASRYSRKFLVVEVSQVVTYPVRVFFVVLCLVSATQNSDRILY